VWIQAGLSDDERVDRFNELYESGVGFISPELFASTSFRQQLLSERPPARLVVDEAHCVVQWGDGFRPDYLRLAQMRQELEDWTGCSIPLVGLTATLSVDETADLERALCLRDPVVIRASAERPELEFSAELIRSSSKRYERLSRWLRARPATSGVAYVAFARSGEDGLSAQTVAERLQNDGFSAAAFHSSMGDEAKQDVVERLARRELQVVVATSAFGMGVDIPFLDWVLHLHPPVSMSAYLQGAGRAGRGLDARLEKAECLLLGHPDDRRQLSRHLYFSLLTRERLCEMIDDIVAKGPRQERGVQLTGRGTGIAVNPRIREVLARAFGFAERHGALEPLPEASVRAGWLGWRIPPSPKMLAEFHRGREQARREVDRRWMKVVDHMKAHAD
jgi:superfamily II DNA helicase RecQ